MANAQGAEAATLLQGAVNVRRVSSESFVNMNIVRALLRPARSATAMACAMGENVSVLLVLVVKLLEAKVWVC